MDLSKILSNFNQETNYKLEKPLSELPQEPDGKSIFAEFQENGNGRVDVEGDVKCSDGTKLSDKILKFLNDNKGKLWNADNNKLLNEFKSLLIEFNVQKLAEAQNEEYINAMEQPWIEYEAQSEEMPVKGVDKEQPVYSEDDFVNAMAEPWTEYEVYPAEEIPVKGPDKPPVFDEDSEDEEETLTLYEPEMTQPPIGKKPQVMPDANVQDEKPVDISKPGAKWSEKSVVSGPGYYSKETVKCERLDDMSIRKTEVGYSGSTGSVVLNSIYKEDGETLISKEYVSTLGNSSVIATANYDESGIKISDTYNLDSIKKSASSKAWNLNLALSNLKDGSMELQDKDGNVILSVKDGKVLNGKGKPIRKDLYDFLEKYENIEGLKLIRKY